MNQEEALNLEPDSHLHFNSSQNDYWFEGRVSFISVVPTGCLVKVGSIEARGPLNMTMIGERFVATNDELKVG